MVEPTPRLSAETCRAKAEECERLSKQAHRQEHRVMLAHMAETWERIAKTYESE
jgi:hypothetical protein